MPEIFPPDKPLRVGVLTNPFSGANRKGLVALLGCCGGVVVTCVLSLCFSGSFMVSLGFRAASRPNGYMERMFE